MESKEAFLIRFWINVRPVKVPSVSLGHSLLNVRLVKEKELLILDKDLCRFRWDVLLVAEKEPLILIHV